MGDRRPLSPGFRGTNKQTHSGGGLPEGEGIPAGITHDLVLQFDLPARKMEHEEQLLAFHGGDVNATLWDICEEGGGKDARFLLTHGADANFKREKLSVFQRAADHGHVAVVEALLDAGASLLSYDADYGREYSDLAMAIWGAAAGGHSALVTFLLDRGGAEHTHSALLSAATNGQLNTVRLLLARGADVNFSGVNGECALCEAANNGHLAVVEELLDAGAGRTGEGDHLDGTLTWAALDGFTDIVALLLDRGVDVHYNGDLALSQAVGNSHLGTIKLLLERGATVHEHLRVSYASSGKEVITDLLRAHRAPPAADE